MLGVLRDLAVKEAFPTARTYWDLVHQINRREVLVEHDRRLVGQLLAGCSGCFTEVCVERMSNLFGFDPKLDEFLLTIDPVDTAAARTALTRLALHFGLDPGASG